MTEDVQLLQRYATEQSEAAFAELTQRHVDLVYSAEGHIKDLHEWKTAPSSFLLAPVIYIHALGVLPAGIAVKEQEVGPFSMAFGRYPPLIAQDPARRTVGASDWETRRR